MMQQRLLFTFLTFNVLYGINEEVCYNYKECSDTKHIIEHEIYEWDGYPILKLPRINLYNLSDDYNIQINIAKKFNYYLSKFGILSFYNHNINNKLIDKLFESGNNFFNNSHLTKLQYKSLGFGSSGYSPLGSYAGAKYYGIPDQPPDLTENFVMFSHDGNINDTNNFTFGPIENKCPNEFYNISRIYIPKIKNTLAYIHKIAAISLNLSDINYFEKYYTKSINTMYQLRWFNYPPLNISNILPRQMRVSQHCDSLGFVLLFTSGQRGAQIKINNNNNNNNNNNDIWIDYKTENIYDMVLNVGQTYKRWTNGHWISNMHRVIPTNKHRMTITLFSGPDKHTVIAPIEECNICFGDNDNRQYKYKPITVKEMATKQYETVSLIQNTVQNQQFYNQ